MDKLDRPKVDNKKIRLSLNGNVASKKRILEIDGAKKSFDRLLFEDVSGEIIGSDSVGIIGDNGVGKTTLLNCILGNDKLDKGTIHIGENLSIGFLDQESKFKDPEATILDAYCLETGEDVSKARSELAKLMFTKNDVYKKIKVLSGGEKKKLKLSILMAKKPTLLILDEPTNHLDLQSREELEEKLLDYDGALLFVSHDRYFLNKIASKIWELKKDGLFKVDGNYDDYCLYREMLEEEEESLSR
jgi:ATPase subunit of ABC transporter with duplicated ATPase domains